MKAIIKDNGKLYVSPVFAVKWQGWNSECVVMSDDFSKLVQMKMWNCDGKITRNVFIFEWDDLKSKIDEWECIESLANNRSLLNEINKNLQLDIKNYPDFNQYTKNVLLPDWLEIKNQNDIKALMESAFGFHDSYIDETDITYLKNNIQIKFESDWGCNIFVKFINVDDKSKLFNLKGIILESRMDIFSDGIVFEISNFIDYDQSSKTQNLQIKCKKVLWKIEIL